MAVAIWLAGPAVSAQEPAQQAEPSVQAENPEPAPAPSTQPVPSQDPVEAWRAKLDGTTWAVKLMPTAPPEPGAEAAVEQDVWTFTDQTVTSRELAAAGYPAAEYGLRLHGDDRAIWNSVWRKDDDHLVFVSGQVWGTGMDGGMSRQPAGGPRQNFSFVGSAMPEAPEAAAPAPAEPEPATPQLAESAPPQKKKRGFLFW